MVHPTSPEKAEVLQRVTSTVVLLLSLACAQRHISNIIMIAKSKVTVNRYIPQGSFDGSYESKQNRKVTTCLESTISMSLAASMMQQMKRRQ